MDFNSLLQKAQRLNGEASSSIPTVDRTLDQVLQATQELHARVTQTGTKDIQAHILLGSKGIDLPKITQKLEALNASKTFEPLDPIGETDIQSFLKNEKENAILSVIDELNQNIAQKIKWNSVQQEWKQDKIRLLNALVGPSQDFIDIQRLPEPTKLNQNIAPASRLNANELSYAKAVIEYNDCVLLGAFRPNLIQSFGKVAASFKDDLVDDMWGVLIHMVDITPLSCQVDPIQMRQKTPQFIQQAKRYFERRYKIYMESVIKMNLRLAKRGGIPTLASLVKAYVNVQFNHTNIIGLVDTLQGQPLWPLVYYSMRCGDLKAAYDFLKEAGANYEDFAEVIQDKIKNPEQCVNAKLEGQLKLQYNNKIKNSTDPFKKAAYCIMLGCDVHNSHPEVATTIDDFLWLQLSILRSNDDRDHNVEQLTYSGLQTLIYEKYGESHFNAQDQAHIYFQVLTLTGQFEAAIEFLARNEKSRAHAVHMALALNELGLLGAPRDIKQPLLSIDIGDPAPMRRLNLARLVMMYVKKFETTDILEALHYYFFLRNHKDPQGFNLFLTCVCDMTLEMESYESIFGRLNDNGSVESVGLFHKFSCAGFDEKTAAAMVADELMRRGLLEKSIDLYNIANLHNKAIKNLSALMSQVVHQPHKPGSMREALVEHAEHYKKRVLNGDDLGVEPQVLVTFLLLCKLLKFFDYYHNKQFHLAWDVLTQTKLVPMDMGDLEDCVLTFKRLGGEICKVFPDLLLSAMDIISTKFFEIKNDDTLNSATYKENEMRLLRNRAKALNNLAAMVPYRMPGDTNKRLVQAEILLH